MLCPDKCRSYIKLCTKHAKICKHDICMQNMLQYPHLADEPGALSRSGIKLCNIQPTTLVCSDNLGNQTLAKSSQARVQAHHGIHSVNSLWSSITKDPQQGSIEIIEII